MEIVTKDIPYTQANSEFRIYFLGDIHAGTIHCSEEKIKAKVAEIGKLKNTFWVGMGDYAEFITASDPRWDPSQKAIPSWVEQDNIAECQRKWVVDLFKPIKNKCIGLLYGNHEDSIRIHSHINVQKNICDDLDVPNLGYIAYVRLRFLRDNSNEVHIIKGVVTHGAGGAITPGAKMIRLERFMNAFNGRWYAHAHIHDMLERNRPYIDCDPIGTKIIQQVQVGVTTGCWFKTYGQGVYASYGEKKNYPAVSIGCPYIVVDPCTNDIKAML